MMTNAISADGLALIQQFEGFCAEPAQLPGGGWVVGHGHVRIGDPGPAVSRSEAADLLALDLAPVERLVNALVSTQLTQSQFDALVSFAYSIGADAFAGSQVLRRVNNGDFVAAACALDAWRKSQVDGELEVVDALVRRRAAEKALLLKDLEYAPAPSVLLRARLDHAAAILGAPVKYAAAPAMGAALAARPHFAADNVVSLSPRTQPKFEPAVRLTEILRSEPATEAVLLSQVANDVEDGDDCVEIVTAHAKPVARPLDGVREATRRAFAAQQVRANDWRAFLTNVRAQQFRAEMIAVAVDRRIRDMRAKCAAAPRLRLPVFTASTERVGNYVLLLFGVGLISLGGSLLFGGAGDIVEIAAAAALAAPGLAATLMGAYGLWRAPRAA
jgi:GH24 family phage-related lysozyme (muramidase)